MLMGEGRGGGGMVRGERVMVAMLLASLSLFLPLLEGVKGSTPWTEELLKAMVSM